MSFNVSIDNRDFSTKPIRPDRFTVHKLTWSAFGGCDQAFLSAVVPFDRLLEFSSMLRCPINITDEFSVPVWWGYIEHIRVYFERTQFEINLADLYNKVKVTYAFVTSDKLRGDPEETAYSQDDISIAEYGLKEKVLFVRNIDEDFALNLRDTFLELASVPQSVLSPNAAYENPRVEVRAAGWFKSLEWMFYEEKEGFYSSQGPGPGALSLGNGTNAAFANRFFSNCTYTLHYAYFKLRKYGSPTSGTTARLQTGGTSPGAVLATSNAVSGSTFENYYYKWFKFTFPTPYTLAATDYWIAFVANTSSTSHHYLGKTDENTNFLQANAYGMRYTTSWVNLVSATTPAIPQIYFRVVCLEDTGTQLSTIATAGNQFFTHVRSLTSGLLTSPYRFNGVSCFDEIITLMKLGTTNQRMILADVNPQRRLTFYEQPPADPPTVSLDRYGRFITAESNMLPAYRPPIGQYAVLSGVDRLVPPFDSKRAPAYFVDKAVYTPRSGQSTGRPIKPATTPPRS